MKQELLLLIGLVLSSYKPLAQNFDLGSWNVLNLKYISTEKWSGFGEAQLRSLKFYNNFHYYEVKGGVNYTVFHDLTLTLAAGTYQTYKEGGNFITPKNNNEFRLWPQLILLQKVDRIKIEQRYRVEMRWTSDGYQNRFRYRLGLACPFGDEKKGFAPFQAAITYELFFTDKEPYFERARMQFLLNYNTSKNLMLQTGYVHQFDYKINDETGRDFFVLGFYYELFEKSLSQSEQIQILRDN
ncbi:MAG: DUF2490 domain-containing protein [Bacteroidia bacterium]|jgi:hypothetical protein|nr:DUF2490 domain-containing protein [Bacteroidia bacterium]